MSQVAELFAGVERYAVWIAAVAAGMAGLLYMLKLAGRAWLRTWRGGRRVVTTVHRLGDALLGDAETGKLGMDERVALIEAELHPNGGGSLRDVVNGTRADMEEVKGRLAALEARPLTLNVNTGAAQPSG